MRRKLDITPNTVAREISAWIAHRRVASRIATSAGKAPRLAVRVTGGMGDHLVAARFVRDLVAATRPMPVDIFTSSPGMEWIFERLGLEIGVHVGGARLLHAVRRHYALALRVTHTVDLVHFDQSLRLPTPLSRTLAAIAERLQSFGPMVSDTVAAHPALDFKIGRIAGLLERDRRTFPNEMAGIPYGGDSLALPMDDVIVDRLGLRGRRFVTVQASYDPSREKGLRAHTRFYPHFDPLMRSIRGSFPDLAIVQIGTGGSTPLAAADQSLVNATSLGETAALLAAAAMHFDSEGGIVHLASCVGTPSCVLFGPTPVRYFSYPGNLNVGPLVCGDCWGLSPTWMWRCPRRFDEPICMFEQDPSGVAAQVLPMLSEILARPVAG